ncbi:MAG: glycosyl hydrolase 2 galactose-binding domain-containing protein, partial [Chitinophagales bacterium]
MKKPLNFVFAILISIDLFSQGNISIDLNQNWTFRKSGDSGWLPASVPGCVHTDLLNNKIINNPFYGDNEASVQWIEKEDWEYQTFFNVERKLLKEQHIQLLFEGLDTYADVYLNDSLILQANNMFREWKVDVKPFLHKGKNRLYIKFKSAVVTGKNLMNNYQLKLPGEERVFTRKAQYQYGWDWGPRFVTCGIWKNVAISAFNISISPHSKIEVREITREKAFCDLRIVLTDLEYKDPAFFSGKPPEIIITNKSSGAIY